MDYEPTQKAEFNMAVSYLNRINILLSTCDEASIKLDIYMWFHSLAATYRELSTWMSDEEIVVFDNKIAKINPMIKNTFDDSKRNARVEVKQELYMELHRMELELRKIANKSGLMMKMAEDAMNALR